MSAPALMTAAVGVTSPVIVIVEGLMDSHGDVLAQGGLSVFQAFCLLQGFVCQSSLPLKTLFDYGTSLPRAG